MKIAISTDNNNVSGHFGRCPSFTLAEIIDGKVLNKEVIANPGHHPGFLPKFLKENGADTIIAGGMGMKAQELFNQASIKIIVGVDGTVDNAIEKMCEGTLIGGESNCKSGSGKGYGVDKSVCDHE